MLLAAGLAFFFDAVILLVFGEKQRGVPKILNGVLNWDFRVIMPYDRILVGVLAVVFIAAFILFMQYSRTGRALRALAQDRTAAQLMGVDVARYSTIGFASAPCSPASSAASSSRSSASTSAWAARPRSRPS